MDWWVLVVAVLLLAGAVRWLDRRVPEVLQKGVLLLWALGPLVGTVYAMVRLWNDWISWPELGLFVGFYVATGLGVTLGFHRMLTHRSFQTHRPLTFTFLALGCMANQGRPIDWAANHLKHHAFSDKDGDPHSPIDGLFHAHLGWMFRAAPADRARYCHRLLADPLVMFVDRTFLLWVGVGFIVCYLVAGWPGVLWGGIVRLAFVSHSTFAVNSICHAFGSRPFDTKDESRNNWWVAVLSLGEGWHNNHHAFPAMAYHGMTWRQFDVTGLVIRALSRLRLVWDVKQPSADLVDRRRATGLSSIHV